MFCIAKDNREKCTGCSACVNICPQSCIQMIVDETGFLYPVIDSKKCVECSLCYKVCPEIHDLSEMLTELPEKCIAAQHKDMQILLQSSSGGAFPGIVEAFNSMEDDIYICGAMMSYEMNVSHNCIEGHYGYSEFQKSKYVQSDLSDVFKRISRLLKHNKNVVFSGTPCQIAGLKLFLGCDYSNLLTIELLCHGVSSPGVFKDYITYLERKHNIGKIISFDFRAKNIYRGMWKDFLTKVRFINNKVIYTNYDLFINGFLQNLFTRSSCENCKYATNKRIGDIVIGDFWGIEMYNKKLYSDNGVSLIIPITLLGRKVISNISKFMNTNEVDIEYAIRGNKVLNESTPHNPQREEFFSFYKSKPIEEAIGHFVSGPSIKKNLLYFLPFRVRNYLEKKKNNIL
jgi:coenzyme F420-reducing hydrogenase beta subunit